MISELDGTESANEALNIQAQCGQCGPPGLESNETLYVISYAV
jgi:hypothetical protein